MIFIICGYEHSVANMYYLSAGLMAKANPKYLEAAVEAGVKVDKLNIGTIFTANLIPVTIGNIIGGALCVGAVYWFLYVRKTNNK